MAKQRIGYLRARISEAAVIQSNPGLSLSRQALKRLRILHGFSRQKWDSKGYFRDALSGTRELGRSREGREALVIANGHSTNRLNVDGVLEAMNVGMDVYGLNLYLLSELGRRVTPTHYVLSDPLHHPDHSDDLAKNLWVALDKHPEVQLVVPHDWHPALKERRPSSLYFNNCHLQGWTKNNSPLKAMGYIGLTAYKALAFALHLGYARVNIIGFDNSNYLNYRVDESNEIYFEGDTHFYASNSVAVNVSRMYSQGMADCLFDYSLCLLDLERCFKDSPIVNLDLQSLTRAFPKEADVRLVLPNG